MPNRNKDKKDKGKNWLQKPASETKLGTGQAEKARKQLKGRMKAIEDALKEAGA